MTKQSLADDPQIYTTDARICGPCLDGVGAECHTPGCCFFLCTTPQTNLGSLRDRFEGAGYRCIPQDEAVPVPSEGSRAKQSAVDLVKLAAQALVGFGDLRGSGSHGAARKFGEFLHEHVYKLIQAAGELDPTSIETGELLPTCLSCGWVESGPGPCPACGGRVVPWPERS